MLLRQSLTKVETIFQFKDYVEQAIAFLNENGNIGRPAELLSKKQFQNEVELPAESVAIMKDILIEMNELIEALRFGFDDDDIYSTKKKQSGFGSPSNQIEGLLP